ncbi:MBL fold metallo-hydrolase [Beijerinckia sp. L45]|uniref:MBL fold metallo-hydrolase n=1 Tax=Beijerinckia sp. L45 TaxID=1641855 RepID=UPI00131AE8D3|nr:MBL fold metallo-hydrolase [Beijerinckia sp. L45]
MNQSPFKPTRRHLLLSGASVVCAVPAWARAPLLGSTRPTVSRFKLGAFEVTTILDAGAVLDGPWPIVGEDRPQDDVARLMRDNLLPEHKFQPGCTPAIVNTGAEVILFDAGNGANGFIPRPDGGWLARQLAPAGFKPEQVDVVVLSHAHPDHIGGLMEAGSPLFPNARYVIGAAEHDFWARDERLAAAPGSLEANSAAQFRANVQPFAAKTTFVDPGQDVAPGIRALEAYGHTPGHLAFTLDSEGQRLMIWGDCAHHQVASLAEPGWHALFDMDKAQGAATRRRIYDMVATDRIPVIGYHMPFPSLGFVERAGSGYRWIANSYQLL